MFPVQIPIFFESGYTVAPGWWTVENMRTRTASSVRLRSSCAFSGPGGNHTRRGASARYKRQESCYVRASSEAAGCDASNLTEEVPE